jgi:O-antigen/teichoic acid export membrane protein
MFRSAVLILSGNASASLLLLARNLIIARLIPLEDYGIAATFAIAMAVVEMMSALGLQQQIVQSKDGDSPRFQAALQGFQVLRGLIAAAVLFALAGPIANFMQIPEVTWAYRMMALVPLFNALQHFDIHRLNRQMRFWPMVLTGVLPALISLLAVWPLSHWFGDYRVMLWAIILQTGLTMVVSHLVAERRYRLVFDAAIMGRSLKFGWPILVNGILLFAVFNGDKLLIGRELGMETLAIFAMGVTLTLTPTLVMAKSAQNFFLPQLSKIGDPTHSDFARLAAVTVETALLMGMVLVLGVVLVGQPVVHLLLGAKYEALLALLTWLAIQQGIRVFKAGPAIVAMAAGQTDNAMWANIPRLLTLPLIWWIAITSGDLRHIIWVAIAGEMAGHVLAMGLLRWRSGLPLRTFLRPHVGAGLFVLAASAQAFTDQTGMIWRSGLFSDFGVILAFLAAIWSLKDPASLSVEPREAREILPEVPMIDKVVFHIGYHKTATLSMRILSCSDPIIWSIRSQIMTKFSDT